MLNDVLDAIPSETLADFARVLEEVQSAILRGIDPEPTSHADETEVELWAALADELCEEGRFGEALPYALKLMLHDPGNSRHPFLAAECMEAAGLLDQAKELFAHSLALGPTAIAAFRLGECLEAASKTEEAIRAFDRAARLARKEGGQPDLEEEARERAHELYTSRSVTAGA